MRYCLDEILTFLNKIQSDGVYPAVLRDGLNPCLPAGRPPSVSARFRFATATGKTEQIFSTFF
jgi:hypothetical protein